jgi:hypothetical protein
LPESLGTQAIKAVGVTNVTVFFWKFFFQKIEFAEAAGKKKEGLY